MRRKLCVLAVMIAGIVAFLFAPWHGHCYAGLLDIHFNPDGPIVLSTDGTLNYDASTGRLQSTIIPLAYSSATLPGPDQVIFFSGPSQLTLDFFVNPDGTFRQDGAGFELDGMLSVGGTDITGTLLKGSIFAFGADPPGPPTVAFNGLFQITSGLLTTPINLADGSTLPTQFPIGGLPGGFVLFAESVLSGILGDFTQSFSSDSVKSDAGATVPEPSSWILIVCGTGLTLLVRQRIGR